MSVPDIDRDELVRKIISSKELTARQKLFLEKLVQRSRAGKWIEDDYGFFSCSVCGFDEPEYTDTECPCCGAKMYGGI